MSARQTAIATVKTRLALILKASGYQTDAGKLVFLGEAPVLGPDDPDAALAVVVRDDEVKYVGENVFSKIAVDVQAIVRASTVDPHATIEAIISDIKKAIETDHNLTGAVVPKGLTRGETRPLDRQDGSEFVGVQVRYFLELIEKWGTP